VSKVYASIWGDYIDELVCHIDRTSTGSPKYFATSNHLYSTSALVNSTKAVVERYRYDVYGKRTVYAANGTTLRTKSSYGQQTGFTGRYHDQETGLQFFRARYYSSGQGRFIGRDSEGYIDGASLYRSYFIPNHLDPTGNAFAYAEVSDFTTFDRLDSKLTEALDSSANEKITEMKDRIEEGVSDGAIAAAKEATGLEFGCSGEGESYTQVPAYKSGRNATMDKCRDEKIDLGPKAWTSVGVVEIDKTAHYVGSQALGLQQFEVIIKAGGKVRYEFMIGEESTMRICCCTTKDGKKVDRLKWVKPDTKTRALFKGAWGFEERSNAAAAGGALLKAVIDGVIGGVRDKASAEAKRAVTRVGNALR